MSFAWTFPAGRLVIKTVGSTAGDTVTNLSPGSGKRWMVLYGRFTLTTDANSGSRHIIFEITDGTNVIHSLGGSQSIDASSTVNVSLRQNADFINGAVGQENQIVIGVIILEGSQQFRIRISGGLAGDSYSGYLAVLEVDV